ncbi:hypothetical protein D3C81_2263510 [compost metagenome]
MIYSLPSVRYENEDVVPRYPKFESGIANVILVGQFGWEEPPKEVLFCMKKLTESYLLFLGNKEIH